MAFAASGLKLLVNTVGGGPRIWLYKSADAHTDVDAAGYFVDMGDGGGASNQGMKVDDVVFVHDSATPSLTMHLVTAVDSDGDASISTATLA